MPHPYEQMVDRIKMKNPDKTISVARMKPAILRLRLGVRWQGERDTSFEAVPSFEFEVLPKGENKECKSRFRVFKN